jgi:tRNA (guanine-N7-)-methyltransferase
LSAVEIWHKPSFPAPASLRVERVNRRISAAMSVITRDPVHRDASSDDDAAVRPHGSFFGRRKGHKLRAHQADLIEHLLPRLALDIGNADRSGLAGRFDPPVDVVRLEI